MALSQNQRQSGVAATTLNTPPETHPIPEPIPGIDVKRLAIGPEDAFVLFRVDGKSGVKQIALTTGLQEPRVVQALQTLSRLGAVKFGSAAVPPSTSTSRVEPLAAQAKDTAAHSVAAQGVAPHSIAANSALAHSAAAPGVSAHSVANSVAGPESVGLEARVLDLFQSLPERDFYALLNIPRNADKALVKSSYFALVADMHPDKYYGKDLGSLKPKLERIFQVLTEAYETLSRAKRRAEYDATLAPEHPVQLAPTPARTAPEPLISQAPPTMRVESGTLAASTVHIAVTTPGSNPSARAVETPNPQRKSLMPGTGQHSASASPSLQSAGATPRPQVTTSRSAAEVRQKPNVSVEGSQMSGSLSQVLASTATASAPRSLTPESPIAKSQARRYFLDAEQHVLSGNPSAAVNVLKLASSLSPSDPEIRKRLAEVEFEADKSRAEQFLAKAKQEQSDGHFEEAGRLYGRAARGKSSAQLYGIAAQCLSRHAELKDIEADKRSQVLREACGYARKGVELDAEDMNLRLLLAEIYAQAGMVTSAIAELEKAATLKPSDSAIQQRLARLRREKTQT